MSRGRELSKVGGLTQTIAGISTFVGISTFASDVRIHGKLDVDGDITYDEMTAVNSKVTGVSTVTDIRVDRNINVAGIATVTGALDANGGATIDNIQIGVTGDNEIDTASGNLTIDSAGGTVTIDDAAAITGNLTVTGNTVLNGTIDLGDATSDTITPTARFDAALVPASDGAIDLGTSALEYRDLYIDGTANIDSLVADTADINGGTADNVVIGGSTAAAGSFTTVAASSNLTVSGNGSVTGTFDVDGATTLDGLTVAEGASFSSTLDVDGATTLDGLTVAEGATFSSTLGVTGTTTLAGQLDANGDVNLGNATTDSVTVTGRFDSDLLPIADGTSDLGSTSLEWQDLWIDGTANIDSLVADTADINGGTVDGATIGANSASTGAFTTISASGNVDFNGDLDVDGTTNLDVVDIDGAVDMATTLTLAGNADFNGDLDVDGTANLDVVDIDGAVDMASNLVIAGNIDANGNLDVDGTTDLDTTNVVGTLTVTGDIAADNVTVNGNTVSTSSGNLTLDSAGGTVSVADNLTVSGNFTVNGTTNTVNSTTVTIADKNFQVATGSADDSVADGGGLTVDSGDGDKTWNFEATGDNWGSNQNINAASGKVYKINNTSVLSATTLGSGVVNSSLTTLGTIATGVWQGTAIANGYLANSTVSYGGVSLALGASDATPAFDLQDATGYPTSSLTGTITNAQLAGSIANAKLSNSTVSFGGISLALGASDATPAFDLQDATGYPTSSLTGTITNAQLAGSIANAKLSNSTVSYGGVSLALGASDATPAFNLTDATNYPTSSLSGTITNAQLAGSIADSKLNTISTAGKVDLASLEIDGGTDIGADLVDADLFIVDDGAGGTNRKTTGTRIKKYIWSSASGDATASDSGAITLANSGVSAATIGSGSAIPILTIDAKGRITNTSTAAIDSTAISQGNTNVTVTDSGTGSIVASVDGTTTATIAAAGITLGQGAFVGAVTGSTISASGNVDFNGNLDVDGTLEADAITVDGTALNEFIADTIGAMVSSNTETNITVTYQDSDNTLDFVVATLNQDTTGNAATATALETARTIGMTGDVTWTSASFDGTGNVTGSATLAASGVSAGTVGSGSAIPILTIDAKGRITSTSTASIDSTAISQGNSSMTVADSGTGTIVAAIDGSTLATFAAAGITLSSGAFVGNVTGNVTGNTSGSSGSCTGNSATATLASTSTITANNSTDETVYPTFVDGATGTQGLESDTGLTYNPSSGTLTSSVFVGNVTGNVTGNTSGSSGSCTGNSATATLASTSTITANNSTDETVYPVFVDGATGTQGLESDTGLSYNPSSGLLTIGGELDAASLDISGNADIDGTLEADAITVDGTALSTYIAGITVTNASTAANAALLDSLDSSQFLRSDASDTFTGTLTVSGAAAVDNVTIDGNTVSTASGNLTLDSSGGTVSVADNLTISGNLTVNGTTTTVDTTNTNVSDNLLELNSGAGSNANDSGIIIERGSTGDNAIIAWDESADKFTVGTTTATNDATGNISITTGTLVANIEGNVTGNVTGNTSGSSGSCTGNAATATALANARTIAGVSFDGTANISLNNNAITNGASYITSSGTSAACSGNAATATALANARTIGGTSFDGTGNIAVALSTEATNITASANNSTDETVYPTFVDGATGTQGIETDTGLTYNPSSGTLTSSVFVGSLTGNVTGNTSGSSGSCTGTAALATSVTVSANNTANETVYPTFVDGATGTQGCETDTALTYNPSSNTLTAGTFSGALTGTATNAALLDSLDSSQFVRADTADGITATLTCRAITPEADSTYDLGTNSVRFANIYGDDIYAGDIHMSNEHKGGNTIDGSWGSYLFEEGENDLFITNRRNGKKFRLVLEAI